MANLVRENIDRWFEHNLDVDNRTLYMGSVDSTLDGDESGVDGFMAGYFIKGMHVLESKNKTQEITKRRTSINEEIRLKKCLSSLLSAFCDNISTCCF